MANQFFETLRANGLLLEQSSEWMSNPIAQSQGIGNPFFETLRNNGLVQTPSRLVPPSSQMRSAPVQPTGFWDAITNAASRGWNTDDLWAAMEDQDYGAMAREAVAVHNAPPSAEFKRIFEPSNGNDNLTSFIRGLFEHPKEALHAFVEMQVEQAARDIWIYPINYVVPQITGLIGGAAGTIFPGVGTVAGYVGGVTAGTFVTRLVTSYSRNQAAKLQELLVENGVDLEDPNSIRAAFSDEQNIAQLKVKAKKYGLMNSLTESFFDTISMGIPVFRGMRVRGAGLPAEEVLKATLPRAGGVGQWVAMQTLENVGGGAGEAVGMWSIDQKVSPYEVMAEVVGDVGMTAVTTGLKQVTGTMQSAMFLSREIAFQRDEEDRVNTERYKKLRDDISANPENAEDLFNDFTSSASPAFLNRVKSNWDSRYENLPQDQRPEFNWMNFAIASTGNAGIADVINQRKQVISTTQDLVKGIATSLTGTENPTEAASAIVEVMNAWSTGLGQSLEQRLTGTPIQLRPSPWKRNIAEGSQILGEYTVRKEAEKTIGVIDLFRGSNISTIIHELTHDLLSNLSEEDKQRVAKSIGRPEGSTLTVDDEHVVANSIIIMLYGGKSPIPGLDEAFGKVSNSLRSVYKSINKLGDKLGIDTNISPEVEEFLTKVFSDETENQRRINNAADIISSYKEAFSRGAKNDLVKRDREAYFTAFLFDAFAKANGMTLDEFLAQNNLYISHKDASEAPGIEGLTARFMNDQAKSTIALFKGRNVRDVLNKSMQFFFSKARPEILSVLEQHIGKPVDQFNDQDYARLTNEMLMYFRGQLSRSPKDKIDKALAVFDGWLRSVYPSLKEEVDPNVARVFDQLFPADIAETTKVKSARELSDTLKKVYQTYGGKPQPISTIMSIFTAISNATGVSLDKIFEHNKNFRIVSQKTYRKTKEDYATRAGFNRTITLSGQNDPRLVFREVFAMYFNELPAETKNELATLIGQQTADDLKVEDKAQIADYILANLTTGVTGSDRLAKIFSDSKTIFASALKPMLNEDAINITPENRGLLNSVLASEPPQVRIGNSQETLKGAVAALIPSKIRRRVSDSVVALLKRHAEVTSGNVDEYLQKYPVKIIKQDLADDSPANIYIDDYGTVIVETNGRNTEIDMIKTLFAAMFEGTSEETKIDFARVAVGEGATAQDLTQDVMDNIQNAFLQYIKQNKAPDKSLVDSFANLSAVLAEKVLPKAEGLPVTRGRPIRKLFDDMFKSPVAEPVESVTISEESAETSVENTQVEQPRYQRVPLVTPEEDAEYLAAVERGDNETARELVLMAANRTNATLTDVTRYAFADMIMAIANTRIPQTIPANEMLAKIKSIPGIKQQDMDENGLTDMLNMLSENGNKVTKNDVMKFLQEGGVRLKDVTRQAYIPSKQEIEVYRANDIERKQRILEQSQERYKNTIKEYRDIRKSVFGEAAARYVEQRETLLIHRIDRLKESVALAKKTVILTDKNLEDFRSEMNRKYGSYWSYSQYTEEESNKFSTLHNSYMDAVKTKRNLKELLDSAEIELGYGLWEVEDSMLGGPPNANLREGRQQVREAKDDMDNSEFSLEYAINNMKDEDIINDIQFQRKYEIDSDAKYGTYAPYGAVAGTYKEQLIIAPAIEGMKDYVGPHWGEPNVIAHMLTDERRIPLDVLAETHPELAAKLKSEGKTEARALHMIEGQSDLHQKGAEIGYGADRVPSLPFKGDAWKRLVIRRMISEAANNGYDLLTWSTGGDRFAKWGSERVDWTKVPEAKGGGWLVSAKEQVSGRYMEQNIEEVARHRGLLLKENGVYVSTKEELFSTIDKISRHGETNAEKLTNRVWNMMQTEQTGTYMPRKEFFNLLYDKVFPAEASKIVAKMDKSAKIGTVTIPESISVHTLPITDAIKSATSPAFVSVDNTIKSLDTVTRDDKGKVIPLSERFNKEIPDPRYQRIPLSQSTLKTPLDEVASVDESVAGNLSQQVDGVIMRDTVPVRPPDTKAHIKMWADAFGANWLDYSERVDPFDKSIAALSPDDPLLKRVEGYGFFRRHLRFIEGRQSALWELFYKINPVYIGGERIRNDDGSFVSSFRDVAQRQVQYAKRIAKRDGISEKDAAELIDNNLNTLVSSHLDMSYIEKGEKRHKRYPTFLSKEQAQRNIDEINAKYPELEGIYREYRDYAQAIMKFLVDVNPGFAPLARRMREDMGEWYLPRISAPILKEALARQAQGKTGFTPALASKQFITGDTADPMVAVSEIAGLDPSPFKMITGSSDGYIPYNQSLLIWSKRMLSFAHQQFMFGSLIKFFGDKRDIANQVFPISKEDVPTGENSIEGINKILEEYGEDLSTFPEDKKRQFVATMVNVNKENADYVLVGDMVGGKTVYRKVPKAFIDAIQVAPLPNRSSKAFLRVLALSTRMLRMGATTFRVSFNIWTNLLRDPGNFMKTRSGASASEIAAAWFSALHDSMLFVFSGGRIKSPLIEMWQNNGLFMGTRTGQDIAHINEYNDAFGSPTAAGRAKNKLEGWANTLREFLSVSDAPTRLAEMKLNIDKHDRALPVGDPKRIVQPDGSYRPLSVGEFEELFAIVNATSEISIDFQSGGRQAMEMNQYLPFFNPAIQGPRLAVKHLMSAYDMAQSKDPEIAKEGKMRVAKFMMLGVAGFTIPAVTLFAGYKKISGADEEDDWWERMPDWRKYGYMHLAVGKDQVISVPVDQTLGTIFYSIPMMLMDFATNHRTAGSDAARGIKYVFDQLSPFESDLFAVEKADGEYGFDTVKSVSAIAGLNPLIRFLVEIATGREIGTGRRIIPESLENKAPQYQVTEFTSWYAKAINSALPVNVSPIYIDHFIKRMSAGLLDAFALAPRFKKEGFGVATLKFLGPLSQPGRTGFSSVYVEEMDEDIKYLQSIKNLSESQQEYLSALIIAANAIKAIRSERYLEETQARLIELREREFDIAKTTLTFRPANLYATGSSAGDERTKNRNELNRIANSKRSIVLWNITEELRANNPGMSAEDMTEAARRDPRYQAISSVVSQAQNYSILGRHEEALSMVRGITLENLRFNASSVKKEVANVIVSSGVIAGKKHALELYRSRGIEATWPQIVKELWGSFPELNRAVRRRRNIARNKLPEVVVNQIEDDVIRAANAIDTKDNDSYNQSMQNVMRIGEQYGVNPSVLSRQFKILVRQELGVARNAAQIAEGIER